MSSNKTPANGIKVPWYGYLMIFLLYATPFMMTTPIALLTGLFTLNEFEIIFGHPIVNLLVAVIVILGGAMSFILRKIISDYDGTEAGARKFNKRLKLVDTLNILLPISSMIIISQVITIILKRERVQLLALQGTNTGLFVMMLFVSVWFTLILGCSIFLSLLLCCQRRTDVFRTSCAHQYVIKCGRKLLHHVLFSDDRDQVFFHEHRDHQRAARTSHDNALPDVFLQGLQPPQFRSSRDRYAEPGIGKICIDLQKIQSRYSSAAFTSFAVNP